MPEKNNVDTNNENLTRKTHDALCTTGAHKILLAALYRFLYTLEAVAYVFVLYFFSLLLWNENTTRINEYDEFGNLLLNKLVFYFLPFCISWGGKGLLKFSRILILIQRFSGGNTLTVCLQVQRTPLQCAVLHSDLVYGLNFSSKSTVGAAVLSRIIVDNVWIFLSKLRIEFKHNVPKNKIEFN